VTGIFFLIFGCDEDITEKMYVQANTKSENNFSRQAIQKKMRNVVSFLVIRRFFLMISSLNCTFTESIPFKKISYIGEEYQE